MNRGLGIGAEPERIGRTLEQVTRAHNRSVAQTIRHMANDPETVIDLSIESEVNEHQAQIVLSALATYLENCDDA